MDQLKQSHRGLRYAYARPRNVGAGPLGPWLHPALLAYQVPPREWLALTRHFIDLLHDEIITRTGPADLHLLDTRVMIPPASPDPGQRDSNWLNEIQPTAKGNDLIASAFLKMVEDILLPAGFPMSSPSTCVGGIDVAEWLIVSLKPPDSFQQYSATYSFDDTFATDTPSSVEVVTAMPSPMLRMRTAMFQMSC